MPTRPCVPAMLTWICAACLVGACAGGNPASPTSQEPAGGMDAGGVPPGPTPGAPTEAGAAPPGRDVGPGAAEAGSDPPLLGGDGGSGRDDAATPDAASSPADGAPADISAEMRAACEKMVAGAQAFLAALSSAQRQAATKPFGDPARTTIDWNEFTVQPGIRIKDLTSEQQALADAFLETGLSRSGWLQVKTIMHLGDAMAVISNKPDVYNRMHFNYLLVGTPSSSEPWGWRVQGHHVSLNFTVAGCDRPLSATPSFWGGTPAVVPESYKGAPESGTEPLRQEDDLPRALFLSLDPQQKGKASANSLVDIVKTVTAKPLAPVGLLASELTPEQRGKLIEIVDLYIDKMVTGIAAERRKAITEAGVEKIGFLWSGSSQKGQNHAFRIQGPTFMIQFDNKDAGNHIHSMWRDFDRDFGRDILK